MRSSRRSMERSAQGRPPALRPTGRGAAAGFTLLEAIVTLAILAILLTLTVPGLMSIMDRRRLLGDGEKAVAFMQRARYQSIQRNRQLRVDLDTGARTLFFDVNGNGALDEVERQVGVLELSRGVLAGGPPGDTDAVTGFTALGGRRVAVFRPDGSLLNGGGLRLRDVEADDYLEVSVIEPATGLIRLRKWDGSAWREQGEGGQSWTWN